MPSETPGAGSAESQVDWDALARYFAGESSAAEQGSVLAWLAARPADDAMLKVLDGALRGLTMRSSPAGGVDVEAALARVNAKRGGVPAARAAGWRQDGRRRPFAATSGTGWIRLAIAAAIVLVVGTLVWRYPKQATDDSTIAARSFKTGVGGRDSLQLPDGTGVVLGPGSRLTLAAGYGQNARNVALEGEGYFIVKHDAARPFTVTANGAAIRDIGTAFGVHVDSAGELRVAVKSGTVELNGTSATAKSTAVLHAGDIGLVTSTGEVVARPGAATDDDLAWTRGKLMFRDATIADVRDDLRRWYGIDLVVPDTMLLGRHLTATFNDRDSVGTVLRNIALSLPASIERHGDTAILRTVRETRRRK